MTLFAFTNAFLMAGTVFGELYVLQVYAQIVAGTVIREVCHCPR